MENEFQLSVLHNTRWRIEDEELQKKIMGERKEKTKKNRKILLSILSAHVYSFHEIVQVNII